METLVGRYREKEIIKQCFDDQKSHFIALYGRRRVGKTFLVRSIFQNKFDFYTTGLASGDMKSQLINFSLALKKYANNEDLPVPSSWMEAFHSLISILDKSTSSKKVVFIDELPWFDTPRSMFMAGLEYFWNSWASARDDILLIGCGSAASWMLNKLIRNKRGLYNRVTRRIKLQPFQLSEVEDFLKQKKYPLERYQIVQIYMVMGGIPFYLDLINNQISVAQNIDHLCFSDTGLLKDEFHILFKSLFDNSEVHYEVINLLGNKKIGMTRKEIANKVSISDGGGLTRILSELESSDFIRRYQKFGKSKRESYYQLIDPFTLFYQQQMKDTGNQENYWMNKIHSPEIYTWQGNAFEMVCMNHLSAIKKAMGISGVQTQFYTWWGQGAQIDLVLDRKDYVINLIEIKFSMGEYQITKSYASQLRKKVVAFREETGSKKTLWTTLITTYGLKKGKHNDVVQKVLTLDDLF